MRSAQKHSSLFVTTIVTLLLVALGTSVSADPVIKPHTFTSGGVVSASDFNENFDTLYNVVNGNLSSGNLKSDTASLMKVTGGLMSATASNVGIGAVYPQVRFQIQNVRSTGSGTISSAGTAVTGVGTSFVAIIGKPIWRRKRKMAV